MSCKTAPTFSGTVAVLKILAEQRKHLCLPFSVCHYSVQLSQVEKSSMQSTLWISETCNSQALGLVKLNQPLSVVFCAQNLGRLDLTWSGSQLAHQNGLVFAAQQLRGGHHVAQGQHLGFTSRGAKPKKEPKTAQRRLIQTNHWQFKPCH